MLGLGDGYGRRVGDAVADGAIDATDEFALVGGAGSAIGVLPASRTLLSGREDEGVLAGDVFRAADGDVRKSAEEIVGEGVRAAATGRTGRTGWAADAPW